MNIKKKCIEIFFICFTTTLALHADPIRIMTFNFQGTVYYSPTITPKQKSGNKKNDTRRELAVKLIRNLNPDIIGFQEPKIGDIHFFANKLPYYKWVGEPIQPGEKLEKKIKALAFGTRGSDYNPIFYNTRKLRLLQEGTFWLNETMTPRQPSKSWGLPRRKHFHTRACTWAQFESLISGKKFWVFNVHLSLDLPVIQKEIQLVHQEILRKTGQELVFFIGDFNSGQGQHFPGIASGSFIDARLLAKQKRNEKLGSFKGGTIDHILVSKNLPVDAVPLYGIVNYAHGYTKSKVVPSDHQPVYADVVLDSVTTSQINDSQILTRPN